MDLSNHRESEITKQWERDPCGASIAEGEVPGSLSFYRRVRAHRYEEYAPWLPAAVRFEEFAGQRVLEIGVGLGSDHYRFCAAGAQTVAADLTWRHLLETRRHVGLEGLRTAAVVADAQQLPFADSSSDTVYAFGVFHHTPNEDAAIAEAYRVLRPGGLAIVGLYHRGSAFLWLQTLLANGIIKGGLWRKGWRRLLSEIEQRSDPDSAMPLVRVHSRRQIRRMFAAFNKVDVSTHHVEASHFAHLARLARLWTRDELERRFWRWGWYLLVRANK